MPARPDIRDEVPARRAGGGRCRDRGADDVEDLDVGVTRVHQLLSGAGPVDAVTNQARLYRRLFSCWGWGGSDVAVHVDPRAGRDIRPFEELQPAGDDVLVFHFSAYAPRLAAQLERPQRKLLVSHNITPARWFWEY